MISSFPILVNLGGSPNSPSQAKWYQLVTPWGQSQQCTTWNEAVNQAFFRNSHQTGRMGQYFLNNIINGAVIPILQQSGTTNATITVTGLTSTAGLVVGWPVSGVNIAPNTTIATIASATSITLSVAATGSGTNTINFSPLAYPVITSANDICSTP
jgi:hypothetical protein